VKLAAKCVHCSAREPLDVDGFCLDYDACIARQPLTVDARQKRLAELRQQHNSTTLEEQETSGGASHHED
jgi:hypothetical protein